MFIKLINDKNNDRIKIMIELMIKRIDSIKTGPYYKTLTHSFLPKLLTKETRKT